MFRKLFNWWKEDILLRTALEETGQAIDQAGRMFSLAMEVLSGGDGSEDNVYEMDKTLNTAQINIRKKVLEHLTINPEQDVTASLVLITIIIDIERVGDLVKNIVELRQMTRDLMEIETYAPDIRSIRQKLEQSIGVTREAFVEGNAELAGVVMEDYTWIGSRCDSTVQAVAGDEDLEVREAAALCLLFRYLKRISLHLRNVASGVVNPFHKVGYKPD